MGGSHDDVGRFLEVFDASADTDAGLCLQVGRDGVIRCGEPGGSQVRVMSGESPHEMVNLVVGLGHDDAGGTGLCEGVGGLGNQGGFAGAGRGVHDESAMGERWQLLQDNAGGLVHLLLRRWLVRGRHCSSSSSSLPSEGSQGGPPWVQGVWSREGNSGIR
jgi:hypothetical protein